MSSEVNLASEPKALGAFYTPATLADTLAEWLVRTGQERILEPSVGEGALIRAAIARSVVMHGASKIRVLACDINPYVIEHVIPQVSPACDARAIDFLQLDPTSTGLFNAVLTNPPFTRNHSLEPHRRAALRNRFGTVGAAGLWVHFLLHSTEFLVPGGRIAAIIPASGLFTDYGRAALERICARFANVEIREFVDRPLWGNDAEERGAVLLADGFAQGSSILPGPTRWSVVGHKADQYPDTNLVFTRLMEESARLKDLAQLRIGAVTGFNKVFLMTEAERLHMGIDLNDLRPVVSRARQVPGLSVGAQALFEQANAGERTWLLSPRSIDAKGEGVRRQLAKIGPKRRRATLWFEKRAPWWKVDAPSCDAIFTYMNHLGPRLVLATDGVACTNTLHCVRFAPDVTRVQRMATSLSLLSTFGQLAAERIGRSYGGGVLKFELKDARCLPILSACTALDDQFSAADRALLGGDHTAATRIADEALIAPRLGGDWHREVSKMQAELNTLRRIRSGT
jgi:hypothetical protein